MKSRELLNELSTPLAMDTPLSAEAMKLLIRAEKEKRVALGEPDFDCELIDADGPDELEKFIATLGKITSGEQRRMQRIIKQGAHYTMVDFKFNSGLAEFFILESAGDPRVMRIYGKLSQAKAADQKPIFHNHYIAVPDEHEKDGAPQHDSFSCGAFALDYACQISRIPDIYELAAQHADRQMISFNQLPPSLVWNGQSMAWINRYQAKHPKEVLAISPGRKSSFLDYIAYGNKDNPSSTINRAIVASFTHYQTQARDMLEAHPEYGEKLFTNRVGEVRSVSRFGALRKAIKNSK